MLPVLITFFNRPATLDKVLAAVSKTEKLEIYFAADGPRNMKDQVNVEICWGLVEKYFPNLPSSRKLVRKENKGCRMAMIENITWFFDLVPHGVILEDDCLPNEYFFEMQSKLLSDYSYSKEFISVSGTSVNLAFKSPPGCVAIPSVFPMVWGWGTWKKSWDKYEPDITDSIEIVDSISQKIFPSREEWLKRKLFQDTFKSRFREVNIGYIDTWDYALTATAWRENLQSLHLAANSIINIGFEANGTHTVLEAPNWVPTEFGITNLNSNIIGEWNRNLDIQIATKVFNCNVIDYSKNQVKRVLIH